MKTAIYIRSATGDRAAMDSQKNELERWARENGATIVATHEDSGHPGTALESLLDSVSAGGVDLVLCRDLTRFGRRFPHDPLRVLQLLRQHGCAFVATAKQIDTRIHPEQLSELVDLLTARPA